MATAQQTGKQGSNKPKEAPKPQPKLGEEEVVTEGDNKERLSAEQPKPTDTLQTAARKFREISELRTANAEKAVALLGNLASDRYAFSRDQAATIIRRLTKAVEGVREKFTKGLESPRHKEPPKVH